MTDRDDLRVRKALQGMDFPADRGRIVDYVAARGDADDRAMRALGALADRTYTTIDDVVDAVPQRPEQAQG